MSRWTDAQKSHAYNTSWKKLKSVTQKIEQNTQPTQNDIHELLRLKKAISFIDEIIISIDPELAPLNIWDNIKNQSDAATQQLTQFTNNNNNGHLSNANNHVDSILTSVRPYMVARGKAAISLRNATVKAAKSIDDRYAEIQTETDTKIKEIQHLKENAASLLNSISQAHDNVKSFENGIFGDEANMGTSKKISELFENINSKNEQINQYHNAIFIGEKENPSIKQEVHTAKDSILKDRKEINSILNTITDKTEKLGDFYTKIFGNTDTTEKNNENKIKGLAQEIQERKDELDQFKADQTERYEALNSEIESLLPGATSAGLATAYKEMKLSFETPIKTASFTFYGSIAALAASSFFLSVESFGGNNWITFVEIKDWDTILKSLALKLPLYAPILWLAFYASKRRSECQRLQQEYAHKEALAKSYNSYKQQIEALNSDDTEMLKSLISKAIDAIAYNASETLDKKHGDKHPIHEIAEKAANGTINKLTGSA